MLESVSYLRGVIMTTTQELEQRVQQLEQTVKNQKNIIREILLLLQD